MTHAGRSVIISGSTVAIGLLSMILLPLPFIRSIGIGGMLIPAVSVLASITLLPALLSMLGPRINRLRVMPRRFVNPPSAESGFWAGWARTVTRRPLPVFLAGAAIVTLVVLPAFHINPSDAELKNEPASGDALAGQQAITRAGIPDGVYLPHVVLVEKGATPAVLEDDGRGGCQRVRRLRSIRTAGVAEGRRGPCRGLRDDRRQLARGDEDGFSPARRCLTAHRVGR